VTASTSALRAEVRTFLAETGFTPRCDSWMRGFDREFSRAVAQRGWVGMTWPRRYGGGARSSAERLVVTEELLRAGAPVAAHWTADRQIGPTLLTHGTEQQRAEVLPAICAGEVVVCLGLSEPEAGRRRLAHHRHEDLDDLRPPRHARLRPGPHRRGRRSALRAHRVPDADVDARHHRAADPRSGR
jgi:alkylation response protein AidB-like acyl-CoA dehydrogenase